MNLISANQRPLAQRTWFEGSEKCRSCLRPAGGNIFSSILGTCDIEECKSIWAQQCLHNSAKIVACYTVEFNYRMTDKFWEVQKFLKDNNYPDQEVVTAPSPTNPPPIQVPVVPSSPPLPAGVAELQDLSARCVAQIPAKSSHLRRYCTIFWNPKLCCTNCPSVCTA